MYVGLAGVISLSFVQVLSKLWIAEEITGVHVCHRVVIQKSH